jgi:hypothetical protein
MNITANFAISGDDGDSDGRSGGGGGGGCFISTTSFD